MAEINRRRTKRFEVQQPALVTYTNQDNREIAVITLNASIDGSLVLSDTYVPAGSQVTLTILLRDPESDAAIRLHAPGSVVRVDQRGEQKYGLAIAFAQAAKLIR